MKSPSPLIRALFLAHVVLLLLASTRFTIVTSLFGDDSFTWNYFQYTYQNGWGYVYESPYTGAQVAAYLAADLLGTAVFANAFYRGSLIIGGLGVFLCGIGALSFAIEGSHWISTHNLSWIASFPAVMIVLWLCLVARWILGARAAPTGQQ